MPTQQAADIVLPNIKPQIGNYWFDAARADNVPMPREFMATDELNTTESASLGIFAQSRRN